MHNWITLLTAETNTTLEINHTSIKQIKKKNQSPDNYQSSVHVNVAYDTMILPIAGNPCAPEDKNVMGAFFAVADIGSNPHVHQP